MDAHGSKLPEEAKETIQVHIAALKQNLHDRVPRPPPAADTNAPSQYDPRHPQIAQEASLLSHERILEILQAPVNTCRHIPSDSLAAVTRLFRAQLGDDQASELLFIFPKLIWPAGPHGENPKTKAKRIAANIGLALAGQWAALADQALSLTCWKSRDPGPAGHPTPMTTAERLVHAAKNGRPVAKTWNQLRGGAPLCTHSEQWTEAKRLLQPHQEPPIMADERGAAPGGPEVTSWPIIQRLKQQRAPDLGGWTHEALQQIMRTKQTCGALDLWLNRIIAQLPLNHELRELLWHHKATLLGKRPQGVRPILIGSVFQKVAAKAVCEQLRPLVPDRLLRMQYALGVPNGIANMTYLLQQLLAQVDVSNAFCSMRREPAIALLLSKLAFRSEDQARGWHSWMRRHYAEGLRIVWQDRSQEKSHMLISHDGIGQGDPLSAMIFGLAVASALDSLPEARVEGWQRLAFMDDCCIVATPSQLRTGFPDLVAAFQDLGLVINMKKSRVWCPGDPRPMLHESLEPHRSHLVASGVILCGMPVGDMATELEVPVGDEQFVASWLRRKAEALCADLDALEQLASYGDVAGEPTLQLAFLILHSAFPAKILHLQKVFSQDVLSECQELVDQKLRAVLARWVGLPHIDADRWRVASLPFAHSHKGGFIGRSYESKVL